MYRITAITVLSAALILSASAAGAKDIAATFNVPAMQAQMALSCADQQALRGKNMLPPHFPGTPPDFENTSAALAINSPNLRPAQLKTAHELLASVPDHVRAYGYRAGATYIFVRRGVIEAVPALKQDRSSYSDSGLYMAVERRLYVPFEKGHVQTGPDGKIFARYWGVSHREPFRIVNHESGHMIDDLVGDFSTNALGDDNDMRLSNRPDFMAAYEADLRRLTGDQPPVTKEEIERLGYYLPVSFEGRPLGGVRDTANRARREVFAELWAEAQGYDANRLSKAFPDTYIVMQKINDFLKDLHERRPVRCAYGADGMASPVSN